MAGAEDVARVDGASCLKDLAPCTMLGLGCKCADWPIYVVRLCAVFCLQTLCVVVAPQHMQRGRSPQQRRQQQQADRVPYPLAQQAQHPPRVLQQQGPQQQVHPHQPFLASLWGLSCTTGQHSSCWRCLDGCWMPVF